MVSLSKHPAGVVCVNNRIQHYYTYNYFDIFVGNGINMSDESVGKLLLNLVTNIDSGINSGYGYICVFPTA